MPYFDLDPKTVMPWDIMGCILFPDDPELALFAAVNDLIQYRAGNIRGWKILYSSPRKLERSINNTWDKLREEIDRHGGLDVLGRLLDRADFHKEQRRAIVEGMIAGKILRTAIQIRDHTENVTRKSVFELVEEEINRSEAANGAIHYHGERIAIKRSEKRLNDCWRNRSCVAHWWAALDAMFSIDDEIKSNPYFMDNIPTLAAISNGFLAAGSKVMIRSQKGKEQPFMNPEEAWRLGEVQGDYPQTNVSFDIAPLADWAKEILESKK